ncbi:stage II sporulation protein P [Geosporobacter subterraneus DSM 17957]|uniref:Stage II sporulation protein P n=1 Tax=Geosporobacter subterraneus DSM 17957 TaxID=1121919 RepID=A0A1M6JH36_9FIRM|nr:stage II sporulation protein P [Geosporobacter subterraneus]SHJ45990.1 stage II sporulation protein P [Geosporobacter subterraneus DSM 17957]
MFNIRVISLRKYYKYISAFITLLMCVYALKILALDNIDFTVQAKGIQIPSMVVQADTQVNIQENLFVLVLNKTIPVMEVNYKQHQGNSSYTEVLKIAINRLLNFDYQDPKTLFRAELSILSELDDMALHVNDPHQNEDMDTREIHFVGGVENNIDNAMKNALVGGEAEQGLPALSTDVTKETNDAALPSVAGQLAETIEVVSSPVQVPNKVKLDLKKPVIFIYHTHGTESYRPESVGNYHSLNRKYTVVNVGEKLKDHLTSKGYQVIHDETIHDHPSFQGSYVRSLETLNQNLKKNDSLKIVFDIHRDGIDRIESLPNYNALKEDSVVTINGERVAKFLFVVGGQNENYDKLLKLAEYIRIRSDEMYPGLAKKTIVKDYAKFNQYKSDFSLLIEVGSNANHIDEAIRTTKYLAEIMDSVIKDIKE